MVFYKAQQTNPGFELFSQLIIVLWLSRVFKFGFQNPGFQFPVSNSNWYFNFQVFKFQTRNIEQLNNTNPESHEYFWQIFLSFQLKSSFILVTVVRQNFDLLQIFQIMTSIFTLHYPVLWLDEISLYCLTIPINLIFKLNTQQNLK